MQAALAALYAGQGQSAGSPLDAIGRQALDVLATIEVLDPATYRPIGGAAYPDAAGRHADQGRGRA
jgi:hypothetical protein